MNASTSIDPLVLRQAFGHYPSGVAALGAHLDGVDHLLVASSFTVGVSLEPALVLFAVQHSSTTWPALREASAIGVSMFGAEQGALCRQLASKDRETRMRGVELDRAPSGALEVRESAGWLECRIYDEHRAGDHDVILLEVLDLHVDPELDPLVFHGSRFRGLN